MPSCVLTKVRCIVHEIVVLALQVQQVWLRSTSGNYRVSALPPTVALELTGIDLCGKLVFGDSIAVFGTADLVPSATPVSATANVLVSALLADEHATCIVASKSMGETFCP